MPSVAAAAVAVSWPERTWKITAARCLALAFIYAGFTASSGGVAILCICRSRGVSLSAVTVRCRCCSRVCRRGLNASPFARLTRFSKAWSMPSIHGRETLRVIGHAQTEGELQVRREFARTIRAGDYVFVDLDLEPGGAQVLQFFRVKQRKIPATGPITLSIVADNTLAPVPWNSTAPVIVPQNAIVPAITSFRVLEVPTVLAGARGNLIVLAQRPNSLIVGAQLYFDTNPSGTFSLLGTFANFAARATLHTALTTAATTLDVDVDMSQVDAAYFTQQYSPNDATNDTMLALVVAVETAPDAGQVAESGGFQVLEICSVSATSLTSAGRYALTVLRGRRNTPATAFPTANTEVWLMPRALLTFFSNALFDVLRANRLLGTTPDHAQFRFCPFTFVDQLALSSAASQAFRFPLKSAGVPALTLTAPGGFTLAYSAVTTWPLRLAVAGTWTDPDANLVQYQILLRLAPGGHWPADRVASHDTHAAGSGKSKGWPRVVQQRILFCHRFNERDDDLHEESGPLKPGCSVCAATLPPPWQPFSRSARARLPTLFSFKSHPFHDLSSGRFNPVLLKKRHIFLLKCFGPVMFNLMRNVFLDRIAIGNAHSERAVARLPREIFHADGLVNPSRRSLFDVLHERCERMRRAQTDQQMHVIRRAADGFGNSVRRAHQSAEVFVQTRTPFVRNERVPVFGAKHNVKMQA